MKLILIAFIIIAVFSVLSRKSNKKNNNPPYPSPPPLLEPMESEPQGEVSAIGKYKSKWLFSYNEKDAFKKLKEITDRHGLYLFAKVRLLDLIEPISGIPKYKTYFYKIQAKHVDFVICDSKLVARCIIELDDNSHQAADRQDRDRFVDEALHTAGYTILHIFSAFDEILESKVIEACNVKPST